MVTKSKEAIEELKLADVKVQLPVDVPCPLSKVFEDSIPLDIGALNLQAPLSQVKVYVPQPMEGVTLATTDSGTVEGAGTTPDVDVDQEMLDQLVAEPTTNDLKIQAVLSKLEEKKFEEMLEFKGYLPIDIESIDDSPVDEDELAAVDSDSDSSIRLMEKDEYIKSLERKVEEMLLRIEQIQGAQQQVTVGDLVIEKQKPGESLVEYILRWRNLSMKCAPQLQEQHAVEIFLKNIHGPIAFLLKGFTIKIFEKLLNKANNLQEEASQTPFLKDSSDEKKASRPQKSFEKRAATVSAVDKGKKPISVQPSTPPLI
ncbi:hypothetical protein M5K25_001698 [Dendrobium thyrsiflorum]|uniref:Uncharacterized protein n=1 Tax=Dendrobium thyrsiflorum TaxID=117978 RepID=A0ABD0W3F7_DENTH